MHIEHDGPSHQDEIPFSPPKSSPDWANLDLILPGLELRLSGINDGDILNGHDAALAAVFLLCDPNLKRFSFKAMNFEFPPYSETEGYKLDEPPHKFSLIDRGISHALARGVRGSVTLDIFCAQFEKKRFNFSNVTAHRALRSATNASTRDDFFWKSRERNFDFTIVDYTNKKIDIRTIMRGLIHRNIHEISDGLPLIPLNIFRYHDHRKGMFFDFHNKESVLLLHTFNFDSPWDIDLALVIRNQNIINVIRELYEQKTPRNSVVPGEGWCVYQDGSVDIDPNRPRESSPILTRIYEMLHDPKTKDLAWSSQFLPDAEDLQVIGGRLNDGSLDSVSIYAPHPKQWSPFYAFSGGRVSRKIVERLAKKYPDRFHIYYTKKRHMHAKCIRSNTSIFVGSSNFNGPLVQSRTTELMLELTQVNPRTRDSLEQIFAEAEAAS